MKGTRLALALLVWTACSGSPSGTTQHGSTGGGEASSTGGAAEGTTQGSTSGTSLDESSAGVSGCDGSTPYTEPSPAPWSYDLVSEMGRLPQVLAPRISGDGRYVVFGSDIRADGSADSFASRYVVRADNECGTLETLPLTGLEPEDLALLDQLVLAGQGGHLLITLRRAAVLEAYVYEIETDTLTPFHRDSAGDPLEGFLGGLGLAADGSFLVMTTASPALVPEDDDIVADVFVRRRDEPAHDLISQTSDGVKSNLDSGNADLSSDARYVAFDSAGPNMRPNAVGGSHVYVRDRADGTTQAVSPPPPEAQLAFQGGYRPQVSDDGRYVAFLSSLSHLADDVDDPDRDDVYLVDRADDTLQLVTGAVAADAAVAELVMSNDASRMTFWTHAFDTPSAMWVWDGASGEIRDVRTDATGTVDDGETILAAHTSADGRWLVTISTGSNQIEPAGDPAARLIVRSLDAIF